MWRKIGATLAGVALLLPAAALGERIFLRSGEILVGEPRFEGDELVVVRPDGTEIRVPRREVERIELDEEEAPPAVPRPPPPPPRTPRNLYPPRVPPPPPPPPDPSVGRRMLENVGFRSGLALKLGYHRGLGLGLEWQQRLGRVVGLGLGAQGALATDEHVTCPTYGGTGRLYVGRAHRLVGEVGFGLNRIDPYLDLAPGEEPTCGGAERNLGPEFSLGYQWVGRHGALFEILGGVAPVLNDDLAERHADLAGLFTLNFGYVFR